jgi:hypothetical protein
MSSAFSIQPCTQADLPVLTDIWRDSFANDPFFHARWPESQVDPAALYAYVKNAYVKYFETPHTQSWKVVDTSTGAIAGWTHWGMPHTPTEEEIEKERLEKEKEQREKEEGRSKFPAGSNIEICEWKSAGWERLREKWYRKEDMFCTSHVLFPLHQITDFPNSGVLPYCLPKLPTPGPRQSSPFAWSRLG